MRVLNTRTAKLREFHSPAGLRYAILSHVWQKDEQSFQDVQAIHSREDAMQHISVKIRRCCEVAQEDGFEWLWIDTCCIDKTSSSELSEAINSMYAWYANATICYAYLHDVDDSADHAHLLPQWSSFRSSKWFTRGWTLQELIAPAYVVFLSSSWCILGTKQTLAAVIEEVTGVSRAVLVHACSLDDVSVAQRMSWASTRETTREEDKAYSLMGIFGVHMSTIYGEGRNSFCRLQEEILKRSPDQTIFAWGRSVVGDPLSSFTYIPRPLWPSDPVSQHLLASSPSDFHGLSGITPLPYGQFITLLGFEHTKPPEFRLTSYGMRTELPAVGESTFTDEEETLCYAILSCQDEEKNVGVLVLRMRPLSFTQCVVGTYADHIGITNLSFTNATNYWRVVFVPIREAQSLAAKCKLTELNISSFASELTTIPIPQGSAPTPADALAPPTYAFFVSNHILTKLSAIGLYLVGAGESTAARRDGLMIVPSAETPASFILQSPQDITDSQLQLSMTITAGTQCTARRRHLDFLGLRRVPGWLAVEVRYLDAEGMTRILQLPPRSSYTRSGALGCRDAHIPSMDPCTMQFGNADCLVMLGLQRWELCHRSRAEYVYMLDINVTGAVLS